LAQLLFRRHPPCTEDTEESGMQDFTIVRALETLSSSSGPSRIKYTYSGGQ
jgi:hypothetical protein